MSRIGKKPIVIPEGVEVKIERTEVLVKGPKGELTRKFPDIFNFEMKENTLAVLPREEVRLEKSVKSLWGTAAAHLKNMLEGVSRGFSKKLELQGIGFRANLTGKDLTLYLGFSHPVIYKAPEGVTFAVDKNIITASGPDKEKVGQVAAEIRSLKPPEPYKGKGIRYEGEVVRRKAGKKAVSAAS